MCSGKSINSAGWRKISYGTDAGIGTRAKIGLITISNDQTLPVEAHQMLALPGVALYEGRILTTRRKGESVSKTNLYGQLGAIDTSLRQVNSLVPPDVIALGCTSAAMVIGSDELERRVHCVFPRATVTNPYIALLTALKALGSARVAYISPYPQDLAVRMVESIQAQGVTVSIVGTFQNESGNVGDEAPFISPESTRKAVNELLAYAHVDVVVVACTQMRVAREIGILERITRKVIISSNQALCWHALRLGGCNDVVPKWGKLFTVPL